MPIPGISFTRLFGGLPKINATISSSTSNINLFTLAGSPTSPVEFTLTINPGVFVTSTSTAVAALVTGTFPVGSIVNLINNGSVYGLGGTGGKATSGPTPGNAGFAGGNAIQLNFNLNITNGSGEIFGGGGGGGGGATTWQGVFGNAYGGGGGGGCPNGIGGAAGSGAAGSNGTLSTPGGGRGYPAGGAGGTFGAAGVTGTAGTVGAGGSGGTPGKAITLNGFTANFISGNDSTHVKGLIS